MLFALSRNNSIQSDKISSRLQSAAVWTKELAVEFNALRTAWGVPPSAPSSTFWQGYIVHASAATVNGALAKLGAAVACVRLVIVNDTRSCLIAGKPEQCQALIAHLGCASSPMEQVPLSLPRTHLPRSFPEALADLSVWPLHRAWWATARR